MTSRSFPTLAAASLTVFLAGPAPAADADGYVVTVLPSHDAYVDAQYGNDSYPGEPLYVGPPPDSSDGKLAFLQFDLGEIPRGSVVDAVQLAMTADPSEPVSQTVLVTVVEDFTWPSDMTYDWASERGITTSGKGSCSSTQPTSCLAGTWAFSSTKQSEVQVFTYEDNPSLVAAVANANNQEKRVLSVMLSGGGAGPVPYGSTATASADKLFSQAPRLLISYRPPDALLARNWAQPHGNWRHGGGTPWRFAQSPAKAGMTTTDPWTTNGAPSDPVIYRGDIYAFFAGKKSSLNTLTRFTPNGGRDPLTGTMPTGSVATALGPSGRLFAATNGTLAVFDLNDGGAQLASTKLDNFSGTLTAGPSGGVYLVETPQKTGQPQASAFVLKSGSSPSLSRSWSYSLSGNNPTAVTLSADGTLAYVATDDHVTAICSASVSAPSNCQATEQCSGIGQPLWSYACPSSGCSPKTPVAADDGSNTVYLATGENLLAFQCTGDPLVNSASLGTGHTFAQPVLTKDNVLVAPQDGQFYAVVTKNSTVYQAETGCLASSTPSSDCSAPTAIAADQLPKATNTAPVLDGNDNLYVLDDNGYLSAYDLTIGTGDPTLTRIFPSGPQSGSPVSGAGALAVGPNGTLYAANADGITPLEPVTPATVTVTTVENGTTYRASGTLTIQAGLPASSSVILQSDGEISFDSPPTGHTYSVPSSSAVFAATGDPDS